MSGLDLSRDGQLCAYGRGDVPLVVARHPGAPCRANLIRSCWAGDMNCDGLVNFGDLNPFIALLNMRGVECRGYKYDEEN